MAQMRFRFFNFSVALSLKLALLSGCLIWVQSPRIVLATGIPQSWEAKAYQPRTDMGTPRRVAGGGTRGSGDCAINDIPKPLTALVPNNHFGVTATAYPTFFVYMPALEPQDTPRLVEFVIEDSNKNPIYNAKFQTNGIPGILTLSLPNQAGLLPLQVNQDYRWFFSVVCDAEDRSKDMTVGGLIRRVELDSVLNDQLKQTSLEQQIDLYAEAEIWHDALATLAQLRRDRPNDPVIGEKWQQLLNAVGLKNIEPESLVPISTTVSGNLKP
ncbi:MAG TPA: DUF928 domain-containing protein [Coleofasciculaceae cyanobacterium]